MKSTEKAEPNGISPVVIWRNPMKPAFFMSGLLRKYVSFAGKAKTPQLPIYQAFEGFHFT